MLGKVVTGWFDNDQSTTQEGMLIELRLVNMANNLVSREAWSYHI